MRGGGRQDEVWDYGWDYGWAQPGSDRPEEWPLRVARAAVVRADVGVGLREEPMGDSLDVESGSLVDGSTLVRETAELFDHGRKSLP